MNNYYVLLISYQVLVFFFFIIDILSVIYISSLQYFAQNTNENVAAAILKFCNSYSNMIKCIIQCIANN